MRGRALTINIEYNHNNQYIRVEKTAFTVGCGQLQINFLVAVHHAYNSGKRCKTCKSYPLHPTS